MTLLVLLEAATGPSPPSDDKTVLINLRALLPAPVEGALDLSIRGRLGARHK